MIVFTNKGKLGPLSKAAPIQFNLQSYKNHML